MVCCGSIALAVHTHNIIIIYEAHTGMENQYRKPMGSDTLLNQKCMILVVEKSKRIGM